jgi:hypothetical protein
MACNNAHEKRLTCLLRFKCNKILSGDEYVAERLVYFCFFDTHVGERNTNGVSGLLAAFENKRIEVSLHVAAKAQALVQLRHQPRGGGNLDPCVPNTGDTLKDKRKAVHKRKADTKQ